MGRHDPTPSDVAKEQAKPTFRGSPRQVGFLLKQSVLEWLEDKSLKTAAALAYYSLFALGPLLLIAVSIAGLVWGADAAREAILGQMTKLVGAGGAEAIGGLMDSGMQGRSGAIGLTVGVVALILGAAGVFAQLREGLNKTWEIEQKKVNGFVNKVKTIGRRYLMSFAGVLGIGFLLLVGLAVAAFVSATSDALGSMIPGGDTVIGVINIVLGIAVAAVLFAALFRYLPDARVAWRDSLVGGFFTSVFFMLGQALIGLYLGQSATASKYGAAGAIPIVLLWTYYSSCILLYGAEVTQVYANNFGKAVQPNKYGESLVEAVSKREDEPSREGTNRPGKPSRGMA